MIEKNTSWVRTTSDTAWWLIAGATEQEYYDNGKLLTYFLLFHRTDWLQASYSWIELPERTPELGWILPTTITQGVN